MKILLLLSLIPFFLLAAPAYYLTWNDDPSTTMIISWLERSHQHTLSFYHRSWHALKVDRFDLGEKTTLARVTLTNLSPATTYFMRFDDDEFNESFTTLPNQLNQPLVFAAGGDAYYGDGKLYRKMCHMVAKAKPSFVILGGDIAYTLKGGHHKGSRKWALERWATFFDIWSKAMGPTPLLVAAGNHDISPTTAQDSLFFQLFALTTTYRALKLGDTALCLLLDTGHLHPIEGTQTEWLNTTLKHYAYLPFKCAHYHIAAYPSYAAFNGTKPQKIRKHWIPLFEKYGLKIGFEHHNHTYKRTYPLIENTPHPKGITYLGDGSWGVPTRLSRSAPYLERIEPLNAFFLISLSESGCSITSFDIDGNLIESIDVG